jgi:hypothetical protein
VRIIALPGEKGRIGKTTTTVNLGVALVETGRRILLLNTDPQTFCSRSVGVAASDPIRSPCATPLGHIFLTETELTVRSPFDQLRAGSSVRLRAGPAAHQRQHRDRRAAHPPGPRSPPHLHTDDADTHETTSAYSATIPACRFWGSCCVLLGVDEPVLSGRPAYGIDYEWQ